mgnify:FL=1|tara:strand:- start:122 stop:364 length:243 start_codon:yes stop_codon:yes gene_type:complete
MMMSNTKIENMIDRLIEMTADPEMPIECIEAIDGAIQSLVDNTDVNKSYYEDSLSPEERQDMEYMDILFKTLVGKSIAMA